MKLGVNNVILPIFLLFTASFFSGIVITHSCLAYTEDGTSYMDLSPLTLPDNQETNFYQQNADTGDEFYFNICGAVTSQHCITKPNTAVCQNTAIQTPFSCGLTTSTSLLMLNSTTSTVTYSGGDICPSTQTARTSTITITCSPLSEGSYSFGTVIENICSYDLSLKSSLVCNGGDSNSNNNNGGSGGDDDDSGSDWVTWVILVGLFICIGVVLVILASFLCLYLFKKPSSSSSSSYSSYSSQSYVSHDDGGVGNQFNFYEYPQSTYVENTNSSSSSSPAVATYYYDQNSATPQSY